MIDVCVRGATREVDGVGRGVIVSAVAEEGVDVGLLVGIELGSVVG